MTALRCQNKDCGRILGEAEGNFRIRIKCRRCKKENLFTAQTHMLKTVAMRGPHPMEAAFGKINELTAQAG
jgi:phage FluMu protein Com